MAAGSANVGIEASGAEGAVMGNPVAAARDVGIAGIVAEYAATAIEHPVDVAGGTVTVGSEIPAVASSPVRLGRSGRASNGGTRGFVCSSVEVLVLAVSVWGLSRWA